MSMTQPPSRMSALTDLSTFENSSAAQSMIIEEEMKKVIKARQTTANRKSLKGALLFNLQVIIQTASYVVGKFIYIRNPDVSPMQLLFMRGVIGFLGILIWFNRNFLQVAWYGLPKGSFAKLLLRGLCSVSAAVI